MAEPSNSVSLYPRLSFTNFDKVDTEPYEYVPEYKCPLEPRMGGLKGEQG